MTSDIEARAEEAPETVPPMAADDAVGATSVASGYLKVALGFLGIGLLLLLVIALKRVAPDFLGGFAFLSYGRLVPAATTVLLYGWLTIGLLGALYYVVPRAAGVDIDDAFAGRIGLALLAAGYLAGAIAVVAGYSEGRRYLEAPLVIDLVTLLGLVIVARSITRVARKATDARPEVWYGAAAVIWLTLTHIAGNIPGLTGYSSQLQASFYRSSLFGLWFAAAAVAIVYFVIPRIGGRSPLRATRLSVLGIWSLGFVWVMTGPAELTYGVAGDWLETIGVIFSIVLFLPLLVIATDITNAMRGVWQNAADKAALHFMMAGLVLAGVYALFNLTMALRASAAVVGFTDWVAAIEILAILGSFSFVLFGLLRFAGPDVFGKVPRRGIAAYRLAVVGLGVTVGAMAVSGVQTGFTWAGGVNSAEYANSGDGWISTTRPLAGNYIVQLIGLIVLTIAIGWIIRDAMGPGKIDLTPDATTGPDPEPDLALDAAPTLSKVRRYAYGVFALAALLIFVFPSLESEPPSVRAAGRDYRPGPLATGRAVYIQEGCAYCHTQQVRPIVTDVGLGPVSVLGDYATETPVLIGIQRYGPDLMYIGDRADVDAVSAHLRDPRATRPWSIMPRYDYLSGDDITALATYLVGEE